MALGFACVILAASDPAPISPLEEGYLSAILRHDPEKLVRVVRDGGQPRHFAALFEAWRWEAADPDAAFGEPLAAALLAKWREIDPQNPLPDILAAWHLFVHERAFPDVDPLAERLAAAGPFRYDYARFRVDALRYLGARRGNDIEMWDEWFDSFSNANLIRVNAVLTLVLREAHFRVLMGQTDEAEARLRVAERIADLHDSAGVRDDEIAWQTALGRAAIARERLLLALFAGDVAKARTLIDAGRDAVGGAKARAGRVQFIEGLAESFARGIETAELDLRRPSWDDIVGATASNLARFRTRFDDVGFAAVDEIWSYGPADIPDDTRDLEDQLAVLTEKPLSRAAAVHLMEFLQRTIASERPLPSWIIPLYARVRRDFPLAAALGEVRLKPEAEQFYRVFVSSLDFLLGDLSLREKWVDNIRLGLGGDLELIAFARNKVREAVPGIVLMMRERAKAVPAMALLEFYFALRELTGEDRGLDPERWMEWVSRKTG
ncbi:MAG: hypothetical protein JXP34_03000 [Planctomycetes bacterium]|nr:hypothetical protein [Planctomycetota bacterium]